MSASENLNHASANCREASSSATEIAALAARGIRDIRPTAIAIHNAYSSDPETPSDLQIQLAAARAKGEAAAKDLDGLATAADVQLWLSEVAEVEKKVQKAERQIGSTVLGITHALYALDKLTADYTELSATADELANRAQNIIGDQA